MCHRHAGRRNADVVKPQIESMINFFRRIRKQLADDNKPLKYMRYAIGEIVLVVIGILIALSINNWNEQSKIGKSIDSNLVILKQNLLEDQTQLENLKQSMITNIHSADSSMLQMKTLIPVDNSIKKFLATLTHEYQFSPNTNAIETITQSNEVPVLSTELRTAILDYYALIERTKEREHISNINIQNDFAPYVFNEYPDIFQKNNRFPFIELYYKNDPRPISAIDENKFLKDKKLEVFLVVRYFQVVSLKQFYEELIESANIILNLLEEKHKK